MKTITLLTDFGIKDSYVAEMKGVILSIVSDVNIIDISHNISPQNILEASFVLSKSFYYFPEGSVHLVVVDPGVGTERDIIVVKTTHYIFVGPDNGVLYESVKSDRVREIRKINVKKFRSYMLNIHKGNSVAEKVLRGEPSNTFHGRDIFAPLAAYCFLNRNWDEFSVKVDTILGVNQVEPIVDKNKIVGKIVYIDSFGNLITNIPVELVNNLIKDYKKIAVFIKLKEELILVGRLHQSYSDVDKGMPLAIKSSRGYIELAVNYGNASKYFNVSGGEDVIVILS